MAEYSQRRSEKEEEVVAGPGNNASHRSRHRVYILAEYEAQVLGSGKDEEMVRGTMTRMWTAVGRGTTTWMWTAVVRLFSRFIKMTTVTGHDAI